MKFTHLTTLAASVVCLAAVGTTYAAPTVYTSQSSFLAALSNPGVDTFNDLPNGTELNSPMVRNAGSYSYTVSSGPLSDFASISNNGRDIWLSTDASSDTIKFNKFSPSVRAVGAFFFGTDFFGHSTPTPSITITAFDASGRFRQTLSNPMVGSFLGFINSSPLTSLTVSIGGKQDNFWPTVNDFTVASLPIVPSVPEPSTWALMTCGLLVIGARLLKRRSEDSKSESLRPIR